MRIDGLDQVMVESRVQCSAAIVILSPSRQRDELKIRGPGLAAEHGSHLIAAEIGHPDVEHRSIRTELLRERKRCAAQMGDRTSWPSSPSSIERLSAAS